MSLAPWVDDGCAPLLTDLYELTMLQAYQRRGMDGTAVFSLFVRRLPPERSYLVACGLEDVLRFLERLRFRSEDLAWLRDRQGFDPAFVAWLAGLRFEGDVYAVPEGTPVFAEEPLLEIVAPLPQAQLVESYVMNQIHLQTLLASKAARVVTAAQGRSVIDFGLRRMHGADAGLKGARAYYVAGLDATSNVLAGRVYGIPISGTMAHSFVQAHDSEADAFGHFAEVWPETVLLVDTYDTLAGVREVVALARRLGDRFRVRGIRLDSGDLAQLAREARHILDAGGLTGVKIFASGSLDEYRVAELLGRGAPIDGFGVGTRMGVSEDAPSLDTAYKLVAYAGRGRMKLSPGKRVLPGRKQVYRFEADGRATHDVIAGADEVLPARPLMRKVMEGGARLAAGRDDLEAARARAADERARLPDRLLGLEPAEPAYRVEVSPPLAERADRLAERLSRD